MVFDENGGTGEPPSDDRQLLGASKGGGAGSEGNTHLPNGTFPKCDRRENLAQRRTAIFYRSIGQVRRLSFEVFRIGDVCR